MQGKLPANLLEFWRICGLGFWGGGKFQFCKPSDMSQVVDLVFKGDGQFDPSRTHVYGFTAFGELFIWNEDYQNIFVRLPMLWARASCTAEDWQPGKPENSILPPLTRFNDVGKADWPEDAESTAYLYEKSRRMHGDLELGECYGFFPALQFGGTSRLENTRKVKALEHFTFLAQIGPVRLFDYSDGRQQFLREIGTR